MKKKQTSRAKKTAPRAKAGRKAWTAGRRNTHKANGSVAESAAAVPEPETKITIGEAMRRAVEELGEVIVDDTLAPQQLRELGECYEEVARRQAAYDAKAEEAKTAKKSLESAQALILEKVRTYTHPAPLPLFDAAQAEADEAAMVAGILEVDEREGLDANF